MVTKFILLLSCAFLSLNVMAQDAADDTATVVGKKGAVNILDGQFVSHEAKIGMKLDLGDILKTGPNSQSKIIFTNGDQIMVGPETETSVIHSKPAEGDTAGTVREILRVFYGKIRAVISPDGPRKVLDVDTPLSTVGVRGTDFFVDEEMNTTKVVVLRGQVSVKMKKSSKPALVLKSGFAVTARPGADLKPVKAGAEDWRPIRAISLHPPVQPDTQPDVKAEIDQLNHKAAENVLEDMRRHGSKLVEKVTEDQRHDPNALNDEQLKDREHGHTDREDRSERKHHSRR